jgi:hypothetical protein
MLQIIGVECGRCGMQKEEKERKAGAREKECSVRGYM